MTSCNWASYKGLKLCANRDNNSLQPKPSLIKYKIHELISTFCIHAIQNLKQGRGATFSYPAPTYAPVSYLNNLFWQISVSLELQKHRFLQSVSGEDKSGINLPFEPANIVRERFIFKSIQLTTTPPSPTKSLEDSSWFFFIFQLFT